MTESYVCGAAVAITGNHHARGPFTGKVGVVLSLGTGDRYCAQPGGDEVKNSAR